MELQILEADAPDLNVTKERQYLKTLELNRENWKKAIGMLELALQHEDIEFIPEHIKQCMKDIVEHFSGPFRIYEKIGPCVINAKGINV